MDVRLPDGTIITNVPEGTTQSELMRRVGLMAGPAAAPKDKGFFSNIGSLIYEGGERAIGAAKIAPSVVTGDVGADKAKLLSEELRRPEGVRPKELIEAQTAFKDEAAAFEKAKGFTESIGPFADFLLEFGKQVITNPKGAAYLSAQSAANMAPQIAGMIAGGKGGAALGSLGGPAGAAIGAGVGAIGGGFAAGAPMEVGSEFIGRVSDALRERNLEPTEENVAAFLRDRKAVEQAMSEARTKGVTTAAVDSLMTVGAGKFASGPRRAAIDTARRELGAAADAAKLAARADDILKTRTLTQKAGRGAGAVGIETAGGGISEAAGQAAAYGKVNLEDVGQEMLGELGGAALEVPAAAYATATESLKNPTAEAPPAPPASPESPVTAPVAAEPSPTQAIEDQATEFERQQQRQEAAMERARSIGIGGGSEINQTLLEQARIRREQQERAAAAEEKAAEAERQKALRAERVRIGSTRYSADPMMNEVLRSRAIAEFDAANAPKVEEPAIPAFEPTKTIEETTPIEQPKDFNVLRGVDARNADFMSAMSERRAAEEATAAAKTKEAETASTPPATVYTGKSALFEGYGASTGSIAEGTRRQLMIDSEGNYYWGDWSQSSERDVGAVAVGADAAGTPATFKTSAEARAAARSVGAPKTEKIDTSRADVDQRVAQVENFLMSPVKKTQQETADYMAGVIPEMQKDFLALLDEDMSQPLTPEQTEALKNQIRQRIQPEVAPEEAVQRTPFKKFLASKGMNKQDVQDIFGENAYRANQQLPGAIRADAPRLDMLAEAAVEAGFLQEEDTEALTQMIKDEFGGDEQVAVDMADDRAAAEYEAQRENELASRAGAIGLNTKGMTTDQIAARLDRIERKREEQRQRLTREVDGFADMPTAEQDRLVDVAMDQFGEPQIYDVERAEIEGRVREDDGFLQPQTVEGLRAKEADVARIEQESKLLNKEAERKVRADEQVGDFTLTGSKRDADEAVARGQMDLTESRELTDGPSKETLEAKTEKGGWAIDPEEQRVEKELAGKSFMQVAQWAIDSAPNAFYRTIAQKVQARLREYERKGVEFGFTLHTGPSRSIGMKNRAGAVEFTWEKSGSPKSSKMDMHINGAAAIDNQYGYAPGVQYDTILHELLHAALRTQTRFMPKTDPLYKELMALDEKVLKAFDEQAKAKTLPPVMMEYYRRENNILATPDELISWGMTDKGVQEWLDSIKVGEKSILTKLVELMRKVLGLGKPYESAFEKLVRTTDSLLDVSVDTIEGRMSDAGFSLAKKQGKKPVTSPVQQSLFREVSEKKSASLTPNQSAQANLDILDATGMQLQPPEPGRIQNIKDTLRKMGEDPALTKDSAKSSIKKFLDKMEVAAFSGDAAFNNDIRRNLEKDFADNPEVLGMLLDASQSQAVYADALATQFIVDGGIAFDPETKKWVSIKKENNFTKLAKQVEKAAEKYGLNKEQTEQIAHTYFVAKRFKDLLKKQNARDAETDRLKAELEAENANIKQYKKEGDFEKLRTSERAKNDIKADIAKLEKAKVFISDDQRAMIEPGLSLVQNMPELEDISDTWQGIRANTVKAMIDGNLWSMEYAESMLDNAAYVPFYRDEQLDEGGGPQEFIKGMEVKAAEFRLKGSNAAVNDVFDNMVRWTQYAINRSVRNHKALQMVDLGTDLQVGDRKMAEKVEKMDPKKNTIRVFRDGAQEIYSMADPLYVDAFSAISNVTIPSLKFFTWFSNLLRQSVVLYPLFSVAQVPQDAISAMFTSGLKTRFALRIPALAVKEFVKTLTKTSATHNLLKTYGATGVRDFNATVARQDIQIAAGLKGAKGVGGKAIEFLSHVAMAADNSVRQAVYEASMQQGLSKGEAIEKAFDIINFRRRGTSKLVNLFGQTVPFFYAYMSVQRTAYKTLTLVGISPQKRKEALNTLATTSGAVMALSLLYVMMNGGDEEYEKTPDAVRDRTLNIPGTGGLRIPLRPDLFLMPKVLTEHLYHLITDTGLSDGAKFRKSVADGVANAVLSPQPIPQAVKPAIEVAINYDFFQGRPLIGQFEKQKEAERQFNDNTSEFSKMLGQFGVSPIAADHVIRGMFGSAGGLFLYTTNFMINSDPDVPRPELSFRDALSSLPGTSGFVTKASENALKTDFYALRDEVEKVKNTYNDIKLRSPQELEQFLSDEKNIARLGLAKGTEKIGMQLSKIRRAINQITNAPEDLYSASEKKDAIKELRDVEREMLKSVDIPALRKMAMM